MFIDNMTDTSRVNYVWSVQVYIRCSDWAKYSKTDRTALHNANNDPKQV